MVGIILGAWTCNYLYVSRMHWIYTKPEQMEKRSKVLTLIEKFKPDVWAKYNWGVFSSFRNYIAVLFYCFICLAVDCNNFFLKFIMWVPPDHKILTVRVAIWAFAAIASTKEFYEFITNKHCKRIGPAFWLTSYTLMVEFSIVVKFGSTMFHTPFPDYVKAIWAVISTFFLMGGVYAYLNQRKADKYGSEE